MDISSIALQGLQQAQSQFENSAIRVSNAGAASPNGSGIDTVDLSSAAVQMLASKNQFTANINVLKIADEMQKSIINLLG